MTLNEVPRTWICQLNKQENRTKLEGFKKRKDKSFEELCRYYKFIISALSGTPAWGVSGVNKLVNELTDHVIATHSGTRKGSTTAYAQAGKLLNTIDRLGGNKVEARYCGNYKLGHILTDAELAQMLEVAATAV